jgi:hypothetical protein
MVAVGNGQRMIASHCVSCEQPIDQSLEHQWYNGLHGREGRIHTHCPNPTAPSSSSPIKQSAPPGACFVCHIKLTNPCDFAVLPSVDGEPRNYHLLCLDAVVPSTQTPPSNPEEDKKKKTTTTMSNTPSTPKPPATCCICHEEIASGQAYFFWSDAGIMLRRHRESCNPPLAPTDEKKNPSSPALPTSPHPHLNNKDTIIIPQGTEWLVKEDCMTDKHSDYHYRDFTKQLAESITRLKTTVLADPSGITPDETIGTCVHCHKPIKRGSSHNSFKMGDVTTVSHFKCPGCSTPNEYPATFAAVIQPKIDTCCICHADIKEGEAFGPMVDINGKSCRYHRDGCTAKPLQAPSAPAEEEKKEESAVTGNNKSTSTETCAICSKEIPPGAVQYSWSNDGVLLRRHRDGCYMLAEKKNKKKKKKKETPIATIPPPASTASDVATCDLCDLPIGQAPTVHLRDAIDGIEYQYHESCVSLLVQDRVDEKDEKDAHLHNAKIDRTFLVLTVFAIGMFLLVLMTIFKIGTNVAHHMIHDQPGPPEDVYTSHDPTCKLPANWTAIHRDCFDAMKRLLGPDSMKSCAIE